MNKRKVSLWDSEGLLAIVLDNSGVIYTNQTCGTACMHPEEEGILIPFNNDYPLDSPKEQIEYKLSSLLLNVGYLTPVLADKTDKIFIECGFESVQVDRSRLKQSHEAWVYVNISGENLDFIEGFGNCKAVLTWQNSD